jgi:hypothetical protein
MNSKNILLLLGGAGIGYMLGTDTAKSLMKACKDYLGKKITAAMTEKSEEAKSEEDKEKSNDGFEEVK